MNRQVDVAIIGAGSAGLSALRQVQKATDNYLLIDPGPLGTTCARVGCMPSKALIQVADDFHRRGHFRTEGIDGAEQLRVDLPRVLAHVRRLRDGFADGMVQATRKRAGDKLVHGPAEFLEATRLRVDDQTVEARSTILATGAEPILPGAWRAFGDRLLTSETIFEQKDLPRRMAVIGLGAIGLELGQALSRLGVEVTAFSLLPTLGGLSDPEINAVARRRVEQEFPFVLGEKAAVREDGKTLIVEGGERSAAVDKVFVAMGVRPRVRGLGLERLGLPLDERGLPPFNPATTQVGDLPVFIAGDVNGCRPILHEALDEGFIAGRNAVAPNPASYCRRTPLRIVFSDPQLAVAGRSHAQLQDRAFTTLAADFEDQSRAVMEGRNQGRMHLYVDPDTTRLLGSEMACPNAEHLGHLVALAIQRDMTVFDLLRMPFYHPTMEEALRGALRGAARPPPAAEGSADELLFCESAPEPPLC